MKRCDVVGVALPVYDYLRVTSGDLVTQAVSLVIAEQTGCWTVMHQPSNAALSYDRQKIADAVSYFTKDAADADGYFKLLGVEPACFVYEEILNNLRQISGKIQLLTGIPPFPRGPRTLEVEKQSQLINLEWAQRFRDETTGVVLDASIRSVEPESLVEISSSVPAVECSTQVQECAPWRATINEDAQFDHN